MAFIRFNKKETPNEEEIDDDVEVYNEVIDTPYMLSVRKFLKHQRRIKLLKNIAKAIVVFIIVISLLRVFTIKDSYNEHQATALQSQTFVKQYVQNYFEHPQTETTLKFLNEYTLQSADNTFLQFEKTKFSNIQNVEIYGVKQKGNEFVYHISGILNTLENGENVTEKKQPVYFTLSTTQIDGKYIVTTPILLEHAKLKPLTTAEYNEYKKQKKVEPFNGDVVDQILLSEITTSIKLFFETWSKDIQQATILVQDMTLNPLSPGTKIDFVSVLTSAKSSKEIQLKVVTEITIQANIKQKKVFTIIIDRTSNKIKQLKEE